MTQGLLHPRAEDPAALFAAAAAVVNDLELFDRWLLLLFRDPADPGLLRGPAWVEYFMVSITALGSVPVLSLISTLAAGFLLIRRQTTDAATLAFASLSGGLLSSALKQLFLRERPGLVDHLVEVSSASFPSGHAMKSAIVYLTLGAILARTEASRIRRTYVIGAALLITGLVGLSRVYLGVHWPTDVIVGWMAGALWAFACLSLADRLPRDRAAFRE